MWVLAAGRLSQARPAPLWGSEAGYGVPASDRAVVRGGAPLNPVPLLDISALRAQLKAGRLDPLYLFVGEDARQVDRMVDAVEGAIDPADRPFAVERLYAGEPGGSPVDIAAAASVYPMLGDRRVVFVLRAERFLKPKRASRSADGESGEADDGGDGAVDLTPLEEYVKAPSPTTTLVFVAAAVDLTRRLTKRLREHAQVVEFDGTADSRAEAVALVKDELAREGRRIEPAALALLIDRSGGDLTKLRSDLDRLLIYTADAAIISAGDVEEIAAPDTMVHDDWAMVNAIAAGDARTALQQAALRFDRGDSPHMLIGQLRWWVSNRLAEGAPERVLPALEALLRTDLALKSSGGDERVLIERLIVELTDRPVQTWDRR